MYVYSKVDFVLASLKLILIHDVYRNFFYQNSNDNNKILIPNFLGLAYIFFLHFILSKVIPCHFINQYIIFFTTFIIIIFLSFSSIFVRSTRMNLFFLISTLFAPLNMDEPSQITVTHLFINRGRSYFYVDFHILNLIFPCTFTWPS